MLQTDGDEYQYLSACDYVHAVYESVSVVVYENRYQDIFVSRLVIKFRLKGGAIPTIFAHSFAMTSSLESSNIQ